MLGTVENIRKRNGQVVGFDQDKIANAIWAAVQAVGGKDQERARLLAEEVVKLLRRKYAGGGIPSVEHVQDIVEKVLIENGHAKTAKAYILYRVQHKNIREVSRLLRDISIVDDYLEEQDWRVRENSNMTFSLIDLCGVDYSSYRDQPRAGPRYGIVTHLLSLTHNWRVRLKVFAPDDTLPVVASVTEVWNAANWFEREAFDLYGIVFEGHADLRRILTDYGFVGHPFRKDFPISGHVEMRYDPEQRRVVYQPVTIEPREIVPRVIREEGYGQER